MNQSVSIFLIYIAFICLITSIFKIISFSYFHQNTHKIIKKIVSLPQTLLKLVSLVFIFMEFAAGIGLLLNDWKEAALLCTIILFVFSTSIVVYDNYITKEKNDCGCYGAMFREKNSGSKILENMIIILLLIFSWYQGATLEITLQTLIIAVFFVILKFSYLYIKTKIPNY